MKISMRDRTTKTLDELLSPDDKLILRCVDCQTFLLPRELHILKRRAQDLYGRWTWEVAELCPVCNTNLTELSKEPIVEPSTFVRLSREQYDITKAYERAGLLPPEFSGQSLLVTAN